MPQNAATRQGLHCLLRLNQPSGTEIHHNLGNSTRYPLRYTMDSPIFIITICMGKSTRMQRGNTKNNDCAVTKKIVTRYGYGPLTLSQGMVHSHCHKVWILSTHIVTRYGYGPLTLSQGMDMVHSHCHKVWIWSTHTVTRYGYGPLTLSQGMDIVHSVQAFIGGPVPDVCPWLGPPWLNWVVFLSL